jgi:hypothetical protein
MAQPRRAWQYLPGQRRVKLAPDLAYDTPNSGSGGTSTYSDTFVFNGAMDRFDWKLVGKKEMYVPYNGYKLMYAKDIKPALTANHINPDFMRWELHRVWVVEATLKPDNATCTASGCSTSTRTAGWPSPPISTTARASSTARPCST